MCHGTDGCIVQGQSTVLHSKCPEDSNPRTSVASRRSESESSRRFIEKDGLCTRVVMMEEEDVLDDEVQAMPPPDDRKRTQEALGGKSPLHDQVWMERTILAHSQNQRACHEATPELATLALAEISSG
jgi:hypothetical protein